MKELNKVSYEAPEAEVITFDMTDVLTESNELDNSVQAIWGDDFS